MKFATRGHLLAMAACAPFLTACGTDEPAIDPDAPNFAVMYEVFDDTGSSSYLALLKSLDETIDPTTSREFAGGRAFLRVYNRWIFVGDPTSPNVTRFSIGDNGSLVEDGTVSFANYGLQSGSIDAWNQQFISPTKAYLFDPASAIHIIWNPTTMEITGEIAAEPDYVRAGYTLESSPAAVRGNKLYRSIYWANYETAEYSQDQIITVYDVTTDTLISKTPETRCPNPGNLTHTDETGAIYFSNWIWPVAGTLQHNRAKNCVMRIPAGSDSFDNWSLDYTAMSGGHQGAMFSYLGDRKALISIFDESMTTFDTTTDPWVLAGSQHWSIWNIDVDTKTGAPVEGIPLNAGAYTPLVIDDRAFAMVPDSDWSKTQLYEIDGITATPSLIVPGWSYMFAKIE